MPNDPANAPYAAVGGVFCVRHSTAARGCSSAVSPPFDQFSPDWHVPAACGTIPQTQTIGA